MSRRQTCARAMSPFTIARFRSALIALIFACIFEVIARRSDPRHHSSLVGCAVSVRAAMLIKTLARSSSCAE